MSDFAAGACLQLLFTSGEIRAAERCVAVQTQAGLRVERLNREETLDREPTLTPDLQGSIRYVDEAHVHNGRLTIALAEAARRKGAELHSGVPAVALRQKGGRIVGVQTSTETVYAETVVVANGAWASELVRPLGLMLPVKPMRGQMLAVRTVPRAVSQIIYGRHMYLVPRPDGETLIGATVEDVGFRKEVTVGRSGRIGAGGTPHRPGHDESASDADLGWLTAGVSRWAAAGRPAGQPPRAAPRRRPLPQWYFARSHDRRAHQAVAGRPGTCPRIWMCCVQSASRCATERWRRSLQLLRLSAKHSYPTGQALGRRRGGEHAKPFEAILRKPMGWTRRWSPLAPPTARSVGPESRHCG